jgi:hypothetical protein
MTHYEYAAKKARELGAVCSYREYYPKRPNHEDEVFAVRFFNADNKEVGYYIPDLQEFNPAGHIHTFESPREWDIELMFETLGYRREL